jgi:hypothetical protein
MDLSWLISFLIFVVIISAVIAIIKYFIMPVVPAPLAPLVWALIGILILIGLLMYFSGYGGFYHHGVVR